MATSTSNGYPGWVCKNSCGRMFEEDTGLVECPGCRTPLVRWLHYEERPRPKVVGKAAGSAPGDWDQT